jgi:hypothetical protein
MSAITDDTARRDPDPTADEPYDDGPDRDSDLETRMLRRPRRKIFTARSAPVFGLLLAACGFLVGVEVEKGRTSSSSGATTVARRSAFPTGAPGMRRAETI